MKTYIIAFIVFFTIDLFWLGLIAKNFYQKHLGFLMTDKVIWPAALLFYLLFIAGLVIFVINPAIEKKSWVYALVYGILFGLISYATYDLTNLATIKNWPLIVTIIDLVWGMILSSSVSLISFIVAKRIGL